MTMNSQCEYFKGLSGDEFEFDNVGDGPPRYNIVHFRRQSKLEDKWAWVSADI